MTRIRFARSARKHQISRARAAHVIEHACAVVRQVSPDQPDVFMYLGDDQTGRPLEIGVVALDDGDLLVIHAMPMREKFRGQYERGRLGGGH